MNCKQCARTSNDSYSAIGAIAAVSHNRWHELLDGSRTTSIFICLVRLSAAFSIFVVVFFCMCHSASLSQWVWRTCHWDLLSMYASCSRSRGYTHINNRTKLKKKKKPSKKENEEGEEEKISRRNRFDVKNFRREMNEHKKKSSLDRSLRFTPNHLFCWNVK